MTRQESMAKKVIGNVGVLDLRTATAEAVAEIGRIGNVGMVLHSPETASLAAQMNLGNLGATVEAPADARIILGQEIFKGDSFKHQTETTAMIIAGQVIFHPDIPVADLEQGLGHLYVSGQVLCSQALAGVIQSKIKHLAGQVQVYKYNRLIEGDLTLGEHYLQSLESDSALSVMGTLRLPHVLPDDVLAQKLQKVEVMEEVICCEENSQTLSARLDGAGSIKIIPTGFQVIPKSIVLDTNLLETLPNPKLFCPHLVQIDPDVSAETLDQALDQLIVEDQIICPAALRKTLGQKCNLLETKVTFYQGELWLVDGEMTLSAERFDYLADKATLVVWGVLQVDEAIEPSILAERIDKVHNTGVIQCNVSQQAALQSRLGQNEGQFVNEAEAEDEEDEDQENRIGNVGHLKL